MQDIRKIKNDIRNSMKDYRRSLDERTKSRLDMAILERLTALEAYKSAHTVLPYVSIELEVDTFGIIKRALEDGKNVACPRCVDGTRNMEFYYIDDLSQLSPGAFSVPEPSPDKARLVNDFDTGLCIVPGLAFDYSGFRLGYGKGYYDRFFSQFGGIKVGICYSECVRKRLPHGFYDKPVDILVTDLFVKHNLEN